MSTAFANIPIVTDGLIFSVDPYNVKSYVAGNTTCIDLTSSGIVPTLVNGVTFDGKSWVTDGVDEYLQVLSNGLGSIFAIQEYTIDVWFKTNWDGQYESLWSFDYTEHSPPYFAQNLLIETDVVVGGNGRIIFATNDAGATKYTVSPTTVDLRDNTWHNITATKTQTSSDIYLDGINVKSVANTTQTVTYYSQEVWIGRSNSGFNPYAKGKFGPIKFYDKELTVIEVKQNYNAIKHRFI